MKAQPYPASIIEVGAILYQATAYVDDGKVRVDIDEWHVRSIKRKPQKGFLLHKPADIPKTVYLIEKLKGITWGRLSKKNGDYGWLNSIPAYCRREFEVGSSLPYGIYTTKLSALKHERSSIEAELKRVRGYVKEAEGDERAELELDQQELVMRLNAVKRRITSVRKNNKRVPA